jgi:hypothetical protein
MALLDQKGTSVAFIARDGMYAGFAGAKTGANLAKDKWPSACALHLGFGFLRRSTSCITAMDGGNASYAGAITCPCSRAPFWSRSAIIQRYPTAVAVAAADCVTYGVLPRVF